MALRDDVNACLASPQRNAWLSLLAIQVSTSARAAYVEAGNSVESSSNAFRCHNELLQVVLAQLAASHGIAAGYPDDVFVEELFDRALAFGNCRGALRWAIEQSLHQLSALRTPATR